MIDQSFYKEQALKAIALTCAQVGDRAVAVDIANQLLVIAEKERDGVWKAKLSREITRILAEAGEFDRALTVAEKIEDSFHQVCGVAGIAYVLACGGKKTRAAGLIDKAQAMAETVENFSQKDEAQAAIAEVLAKLGKFDRALAVIETSSAYYRASSLSQIAFALSEAGEQAKALNIADQALAIAEKVQDKLWKVAALREVAWAFAEAGERRKTADLISQLLAMPVSKHEAQMLQELMQDLVRVGDRIGAKRIADHLLEMAGKAKDVGQKAEAMSEAAYSLAMVGEVERTIEIANQVLQLTGFITDGQGEVWAMDGVARSLAQIGEFDRALEVVKRIEDTPLKVYGFSIVANALSQAGQKTKAADAAARAALLMMPLGQTKMEEAVPKTVVWTLAASGELDQALEIVEATSDERSKALALSWISYATIEAGERGRGLEFAEQSLALGLALNKEWDRDDVLVEVVRAFLQAGEFNRALTAAGMIGDKYSRHKKVATLSEVAQKLIEAGEKAKLVEVADQVLVLAETSENEDEKLTRLDKAAHMLYEAGEKESAVAVADQLLTLAAGMEDEYQQLPFLGKAAQILAELGEKYRALAITSKVESIVDDIKEVGHFVATNRDGRNNELKESALCSIVQALAEIEEGSRAVEVAKKMPTWPSMLGTPKGGTLNKVAQRLMQEGQFDLALTLTEVIENPDWKDTTLRDIAQSMAQAGRFEGALSVASKIGDKSYKRQAMIGIVYALAQAGHHERALGLWRGELARARLAGRAEVFDVLQAGMSFIMSLDHGVTLWKIYEAVMEVEGWWVK